MATAAAADFTVFPCGAADCSVAALATDAAGNTYVAGNRYFPMSSATPEAASSDVFVARLGPDGALGFRVTFGGKGSDQARAIALDPAGNIFVGGSTSSPNFPLRNPLQSERAAGGSGFLVKLSPDGSQVIFSTYFGGLLGPSEVRAVAADPAGNLYVTGQTGSRDFPASPGMPAGHVTGFAPGGILGAFFAKLSPEGDRLLYSGRISGNGVACGAGSSCFLSMRNISGDAIAVDPAGNAFIAGYANVTDLPVTDGALARQGIGAWVARINASGVKMDYLTYLGAANYVITPFASPATVATGLAVDAAGNAYITGSTRDPKFPATGGAFQPVFNGPSGPPPYPGPPADAFVAKLDPQGTAMLFATFLGGSGADSAVRIGLDPAGAVYVTGNTDSTDFPVTAGSSTGSEFVAALNPDGSALTFSSRYPGGSVAQALAVDAAGGLRVANQAGIVTSLDPAAPARTRLFGIVNTAGGLLGAAVAPGEVVSIVGTRLGPPAPVHAEASEEGRMPAEVAGTRVFFDGLPAPLLYVSEQRIDVVTPFALSPGGTRVRVAAADGEAALDAVVVAEQPAIFRKGESAAVNEDGTSNTESNPARLGSVVSIWATGVGTLFPAPTDGQIAAEAYNYHCCGVYFSEQKSAEVLYAGAAPGTVAGVVQINFRLPEELYPARRVLVRVTAHRAGATRGAPAAVVFLRP